MSVQEITKAIDTVDPEIIKGLPKSETDANQSCEKVDKKMANVELVTMTRGKRGRQETEKPKLEDFKTKDEHKAAVKAWQQTNNVEYQGINDSAPRPDNPMDAAMELVKGDLQNFWDRYVKGFNEFAYEAVADPIARYLTNDVFYFMKDDVRTFDEDKAKNFRIIVNTTAKMMDLDKEVVAEKLLADLSA